MSSDCSLSSYDESSNSSSFLYIGSDSDTETCSSTSVSGVSSVSETTCMFDGFITDKVANDFDASGKGIGAADVIHYDTDVVNSNSDSESFNSDVSDMYEDETICVSLNDTVLISCIIVHLKYMFGLSKRAQFN